MTKPSGNCSSVTVMMLCLVLLATPAVADSPETLSSEELEKGMTGYGRTVFEGTEAETFPVEVLGVLNNVMPDQDIILIKANTDLLNHTMIMSGMSGSPIYINDRLIGALAYSWSFEKEPIAGVTPIENILEARQRKPLKPDHGSLRRIATPMVASGFRSGIKDDIQQQLGDAGMRTDFIAGGQAQSATGQGNTNQAESLSPGSAVGVQLMRGDLSLTAIGTVTHVSDSSVWAFGHPFRGAGQIEFPMTTARVHTYMPSYQSSFKLASPMNTVGTVTEDRQASIVGQTGVRPDLLPVTIQLSSPDQGFESTHEVELIRDRFLTPGLINSAVSNFAGNKLEQQGVNWLELEGTLTLKDGKEITFSRTQLVAGSFSSWTLMPLADLWSNRFRGVRPHDVTIDVTLHHGRQSAEITDIWTAGHAKPGEDLTVYTRIDPFRSSPTTESVSLSIPSNVRGQMIRVSAVPASQLKQLSARPESFNQLVNQLSVQRSPRKLAIVAEIPEFSMRAAGHRMKEIPFSVMGSYESARGNQVQGGATTRQTIRSMNWILGGSQSVDVPLKNP